MRVSKLTVWAVVLCLCGSPLVAQAQFMKGDDAPLINATDVNGKQVDLNKIIEEGRDLVLLFFFTTQTGEDMAVKLGMLDMLYGGKQLDIIALGLKEDEAALKAFAENLAISYYIIDDDALGNAAWLQKIDVLPLTLFVVTETKKVDKIVTGGGSTKARLLEAAAEAFFQRRQTAEASAILTEAVKAGEDPKAAAELNGFVLTAEGKLDDAAAEFGKIESGGGLAKVAYEQGDYQKAIDIADAHPGDGYAQTIKAQALIKLGKAGDAAQALEAAQSGAAYDWQQAEAVNTQGRILHQSGDTDAAIKNYQQAVALDPYNVIALSNEGAAQREKGDLAAAEAVLERASSIRADDMTTVLLKQVQKELEEANDVKRGELIRGQIADLKARFDEMKASGKATPADVWSTRPLVLAFLPSRNQGNVFFDRAGTDIVLQREIETRLQGDDRCSVVERSMLDQLLQELNLGSSDLASADTQRRLGQVLSAGLLGFIEYVQSAAGTTMYVRLVDTETTSITMQASQPVDENNPSAVAEAVVTKILDEAVNGRELKGLIADASDENAVIINLGKKHGVNVGDTFIAVKDGAPVEVGGRVIAVKQEPAAKLEVTTAEEEYAICKVVKKVEGAELTKEMKIKATK